MGRLSEILFSHPMLPLLRRAALKHAERQLRKELRLADNVPQQTVLDYALDTIHVSLIPV